MKLSLLNDKNSSIQLKGPSLSQKIQNEQRFHHISYVYLKAIFRIGHLFGSLKDDKAYNNNLCLN